MFEIKLAIGILLFIASLFLFPFFWKKLHKEAEIEIAKDLKQQRERSARRARSKQIENITQTLILTNPGSVEENRLFLILDNLALSHEEWDMIYYHTQTNKSVSSDRPRLMERKIRSLENRKGP